MDVQTSDPPELCQHAHVSDVSHDDVHSVLKLWFGLFQNVSERQLSQKQSKTRLIMIGNMPDSNQKTIRVEHSTK